MWWMIRDLKIIEFSVMSIFGIGMVEKKESERDYELKNEHGICFN